MTYTLGKTPGFKQLLNLLPTSESIAEEASELHRAAVSNDRLLLEHCLNDTNCDVNIQDKWNHTALYSAVQKGHIEIVKTLLEHEARINANENKHFIDSNPLHIVRDLKIAELLVTAGGDVNARESFGKTPIQRAILRKEKQIVRFFIKHGALLDIKDNSGATVLHECCQYLNGDGCVEILEILKDLIAGGADVNSRDYFLRTPLHLVAKQRYSASAARILISHGADMSARDYSGNCPVHYCFCQFLPEEDEKNFLNLLEEFLSTRENLEYKDTKGQTVLHLAAQTSLPLVKSVVDRGCSVECRDNFGKTALHAAASFKKKTYVKYLIEYLIERKTPIDAQDDLGQTPMHLAALSNNKDVTEVLLQYGGKVDVKDNNGRVPLHDASAVGACEIIDILIINGASVNALDTDGSTPLHLAAWDGNEIAVKILLSNGGDTQARDSDGQSPLDVAVFRRNEEAARTFLQFLREKEVSINLANTANSKIYSSFSNAGRKKLPQKTVLGMIANNEIRRPGSREIVGYLQDILATPGIGRGADDEESVEIQIAVKYLVHNLTKRISLEDPRLKCTFLHVGSISEGTKTRQPDEFDFLFALTEFSKHCQPEFLDEDTTSFKEINIGTAVETDPDSDDHLRHMNVSISDYANMRVIDTPDSKPFIQYSGSTLMPLWKMYDGFTQLITRILFSRDFPRHHRLSVVETTIDPAMQLCWKGVKYKHLTINVDLVPAIILENWPPQYSRDKVLLTPDILRLSSFVVPKMTAGTDKDLWRCSLVLAETTIFRKLRPEIRNSYIACKALLHADVCPFINFGRQDELVEAYRMQHDSSNEEGNFEFFENPETIVPSYVLKMAFFTSVEKKARTDGVNSVYIQTDQEDIESTKQAAYTDEKHENVCVIPDTICSCNEVQNEQLQSSQNDKERQENTRVKEIQNIKAFFGPAEEMNIAMKNFDLNVSLVMETFRRCERCLEKKFAPSFFNEKHNVLGQMVMEEDAGKVLLYIRYLRALLG